RCCWRPMPAPSSYRSMRRPGITFTSGQGGSSFWAIFGSAVPDAAWWLGIPGALYALMLKSVALVLAILAVIFLLQNRVPVAAWISGEPAGASGWARVRRSLGEVWHVLAILYIAGIYVIYALHTEGGFLYVLRATALSLIVIIAARVIVRFVQGLSRRGFAIKPELKAQFPTLEYRANRYPDPDGTDQSDCLYPSGADRAAGLEYRGVCVVRLRSRPARHWQRAVDRRGADHCARAMGARGQRDRAVSDCD